MSDNVASAAPAVQSGSAPAASAPIPTNAIMSSDMQPTFAAKPSTVQTSAPQTGQEAPASGQVQGEQWLLPQYKDRHAVEKAYKELQSKHDRMLAGFTGAPEGDYTFEPSESLLEAGYDKSVEMEFVPALNEFARAKNMSQASYQEAREMITAMSMKNAEAERQYIVESVDNYTEKELSKFGQDRAGEMYDALSMAARMPGVTSEGLNDLIDSPISADGLNTLLAIIKNNVSSDIPAHAPKVENSYQDLQAELKRIDSMPYGFQKDDAMKQWRSKVANINPKTFR